MRIETKDLLVEIAHKKIIENISVDISSGEFSGVVGPNGSGKSTLLKTIYRVLKPDSGYVMLDNININEIKLKESAKKLGVLTQMSNFSFDFTVEEVVMMGRTPHKQLLEADNEEDYRIVNDSISKVGMEDFTRRKFNTLSGGEKQRVLIARAITARPKALILDEPTNHLDIHYQISLLNVVKSLGIVVFSAMHDLNLAAMYCNRIYVMKRGNIVLYGTPEEVLTTRCLKDVFNVNAIVEQNKDTGKLNIIYTDVE